MTSAEAGAATLGPRYAPDDPTLPKSWKGLIDGSTGLMYYWNPETNVTQYERPTVKPPSLPLGPPPVSTPKLAPIPAAHSAQPNGAAAQMGQIQVPQGAQQQGQQMSQLTQQQGQIMGQQPGSMAAQVSDQHGSQQPGPQMGQHGQFIAQKNIPQTMQHPNQQMMNQIGQQTMQHQNSQMGQPRGHQYAHQHLQYMGHQQSVLPQGQQSSQQLAPHGAQPQGQQYPNQEDYKAAGPRKEDVDFQLGNQTGFSPAQFQQMGNSSQNQSAGTNSVPMPQPGYNLGQAQQFTGSSINMPPPTSIGQSQQTGTDLVQRQQGHRFQNQMGPSMIQTSMPPPALNTSYEDKLHGRSGNDYYFNSGKDGPMMGPRQPLLSAIPRETWASGLPPQNAIPGHGGGFNPIGGHGVHNMYGHTGPPFPNNSLTRPPFVPSVDTSNMSPAEAYCKQHEVTATGDSVPAPFIRFEDTGFPPEILREIHSAGFSSPTPIQAQTWPIALQSRDIVAIAKTGSGKTLGYLIPAFMLLRQRRNNSLKGPTVLVLAPTRELATQIQVEVIKFGQSSRVSSTCLYGGAPKANQLKELDRGADIVVATPGRLNDILEMKKIEFGQVSLLVLDEADRMLDMGFEPQIRKIVNEIPPRRQTLMYTATWPKEVRKIAADLLVNPVQVNIGSVDELAANKSITQYVEVVPQMEKERRLGQILQAQERGSKVIIFCSTKRLCDQLARSLGRNFGAVAFHGDKSQTERDWVLSQFRSGKSPILVATDVAARGLDIKDIRVVINFDFPTGIEDYVHRIGRTGRAGATGVSFTFFSEQDWKYAPDLIQVLERANQHVPPEVREIASHGGPGFGKYQGGMNRFNSGGSGGRWDNGGRGGMRDGGFGGRGGMRDGGFGGRGGTRDGGFGGRGDIRDGGFGGPGGRGDPFSGRGNRGRGFGGPAGGQGGWGRNERSLHDQNNSFDGRGRGRYRGRGRFDNRRGTADRSGGRSYSRSPDMVRTWRHSRSRSRSRSWSRSRSRSRSWSRGRSYSRSPRRSYSCSPGRGRSHSHGRRSRSRSLSYDRYEKPNEQNAERKGVVKRAFDSPVSYEQNLEQKDVAKRAFDSPPSHEQNTEQKDVAKQAFDSPPVSTMSPGGQGTSVFENSSVQPLQTAESAEVPRGEVGAGQVHQSMTET
ncbi:DEAD-box ATP-dependent RNA helicase 40 [Hibiscus syriacus]|uniref:RNA helicase n=1 Tax=Hibiscus syriacus TaxID=106335 RepID=A0A6A3C4V3_HIBSY|nr:DEAD-box ATP-dependent RNA helicase 46-like [Hibiscus syriacus]KAE8724210.1 DEAD-box ATP-dependent RNA helicase 40 [Hibiscus syriacus]